MDWVAEFFDDEFFARDFSLMKEETELTAREARFIRDALKLGPADHVLDLACGFGRHALALAPHVAMIHGIDRTASYIADARGEAARLGLSNATFEVVDMRELEIEARFDAAYNYFTAWGYYDDETNFDVLERFCRALKPGGRFLMEYVHRDAQMRRFRPRSWVRRSDGVLVLYEWRLDFATGRFHMKHIFIDGADVREIEGNHALPASDELVRLLKRAGFSEARLVSAPDGGPLTLGSSRLAAIAVV